MNSTEKARETGYLMSRIDVAAELSGKMSGLKSCLEAYPGLKLESEGTSLLYELEDDGVGDRFYSVECGKSHIALTIFSKQTPVLFMQEAMLRLLAVAQITSKHYRIDLSSLYPYLVIAMASQQIGRIMSGNEAAKEDDSDLILSKRLISLMKQNSALMESAEIFTARFRKLTQKAITLSSTGNTSMEDLERDLCLSKGEISEALSGMRQAGYSPVYLGKDRFSLVKA